MASVIQRAAKLLSELENAILKTVYFRYPTGDFAPALISLSPHVGNYHRKKNLLGLLEETILWAVPKKRRSIEKRRCRRFGWPDGFYKMLVPKKNILICNECGLYYEAGLLCPHCYSKVRAVTEEMQEAIQEKLGISPVEEEVVVLYSNDEKQDPEFYKGKRIVEMKKERPKLFCDNLLQRSTQLPAATQELIEKK